MATPTPTAAGRSSGADSPHPYSDRDWLLLILAVAKDVGVDPSELAEAGIHGVAGHVESLRAEGHVIHCYELRNGVDEVVGRRYVLGRQR